MPVTATGNYKSGVLPPGTDLRDMLGVPKSVAAVVWDFQLPDQQGRSNKTFFSKLVPSTKSAPVTIRLSGLAPGSYELQIHRTGYKANDAYSAYIEMGAPEELSPAQLRELQRLTRDLPETRRTISVPRDGTTPQGRDGTRAR